MKTYAKKYNAAERYIKQLQHEKAILERIIKDQYRMEQQAQRRANITRMQLDMNMKYVLALAKRLLHHEDKIELDIEDVRGMKQSEVKCQVETGDTGEIKKLIIEK